MLSSSASIAKKIENNSSECVPTLVPAPIITTGTAAAAAVSPASSPSTSPVMTTSDDTVKGYENIYHRLHAINLASEIISNLENYIESKQNPAAKQQEELSNNIYAQTLDKIAEDTKTNRPTLNILTQDKIDLANRIIDQVTKLRAQLRETTNINTMIHSPEDCGKESNESPITRLILNLLDALKAHEELISNVWPDTLISTLGSFCQTLMKISIIRTPLQFISKHVHSKKLGAELDDLAKAIMEDYPDQAILAKEQICKMAADDVRMVIFPEFLADLERYTKTATERNNNPLTTNKIRIAAELKEKLITECQFTTLKNSLSEKRPDIRRGILRILEAKEQHQKSLGDVGLAANRQHLGETFGGIINYCFESLTKWAANTFYHANLGEILDNVLRKIELFMPGEIDLAKRAVSPAPPPADAAAARPFSPGL